MASSLHGTSIYPRAFINTTLYVVAAPAEKSSLAGATKSLMAFSTRIKIYGMMEISVAWLTEVMGAAVSAVQEPPPGLHSSISERGY